MKACLQPKPMYCSRDYYYSSKRKLSFDKQHETLDNEKEEDSFIETSIFDHLAFNVFIFVMAIISVIVMFIVIKLIFKGEKMQMLLPNLAMIRGAKQ